LSHLRSSSRNTSRGFPKQELLIRGKADSAGLMRNVGQCLFGDVGDEVCDELGGEGVRRSGKVWGVISWSFIGT
jgi:hypothetical protein